MPFFPKVSSIHFRNSVFACPGGPTNRICTGSLELKDLRNVRLIPSYPIMLSKIRVVPSRPRLNATTLYAAARIFGIILRINKIYNSLNTWKYNNHAPNMEYNGSAFTSAGITLFLVDDFVLWHIHNIWHRLYIRICCISDICLIYKYLYIMHMFYIELISSMRISEETKKAIIKIGAEVTAKDGKDRSMEDVVKLLIEHYRKMKC